MANENADSEAIYRYLTSGASANDDEESQPSRPAGRRTRRGGGMSRKPRLTDGKVYPVEVRNKYSGTPQDLREAAIADAIEHGVDPSEVRATGPGRFEFIIR